MRLSLAILIFGLALIGQPSSFMSATLEWDYASDSPERFVLRYQAASGTNAPIPNANWPVKMTIDGTNRTVSVTFPTGSYHLSMTAETGITKSDFSNVVTIRPLPSPVLRIK